jgi:flagellar hook protein FlgE
MALTTSLYTSLSGMTANSQAIAITGNNIANANTTAFKSSRADFETQVSQNLSSGTAPSAVSGGTNPVQIGLGTRLAAATRTFTNGPIQPTGVNTDLAIEGGGFFVLKQDGVTRYTRAGNFTIDSDSMLVGKGHRVQGYGVDDQFNIVEGVIGDMAIPIGMLTIAQATSKVRFAGNLNAAGDVAQNGTRIVSSALFSDAAATTPAGAGDSLAGLHNIGGQPLFNVGDIITISGASKGNGGLPERTFEVADPATFNPANPPATGATTIGATLADFMNFLRGALGIHSDIGGGVTVDAAGQIVIEGNTGERNDIHLELANVLVNKGTAEASAPLSFAKQQAADGESVRTTFISFDSLGNELVLDMTMVLEQKSAGGTEWRFYVQSGDADPADRALGSGTLRFDNSGRLVDVRDNFITIDRGGSGALTPQQVEISFSDPQRAISALSDTTSQVAATSQDGFPIGTLQTFSIAEDGVIRGVFSNGLTRSLGQLVLATVSNPEGMIEIAGGMYEATASSGTAAITSAGKGGAGRIIGGALELSNVDLSLEFIRLITASTGFSANSRVLSTSDRLMQELLAIVR